MLVKNILKKITARALTGDCTPCWKGMERTNGSILAGKTPALGYGHNLTYRKLIRCFYVDLFLAF